MNVGQMQYLRIKDWRLIQCRRLIGGSTDSLPANTFPQRWQHKIAVVHEGVPEGMLHTTVN